MYLSQQKTQEQWRTYLPFLYNFYYEHKENNFVDVIAAKWNKNKNHKPNTMSFIIAGLSKVQHLNQQYSYTIEEYLIKSFQLILPQTQSQNIQRRFPYVVEKKKIFYQRQITSLQDIIITQQNTSQISFETHYYAVAIKNDSIRILSAAKLAAINTQNKTIFNEKSPFLPKNIKETNLCMGNQTEVAIIPLQKEVNVIKFQQKEKSLLCGCQDGTIVMINLFAQLGLNGEVPPGCYTYFTYHKSPVRDLTFLTDPDDQRLLFASVGADGSFYLWRKQSINGPSLMIEQGSLQPSSVIEVYPNQLIQSGRDCGLKFFDIKKGYSYNYNQNNQIITHLYNLTSLIQYQKNIKQTQIDNSLRFVSCQHSGKIVFWQGEKQFQHLTHKSRIASLDFININTGLFLAIEKQTAKISFFSPVLFTNCLEDPTD